MKILFCLFPLALFLFFACTKLLSPGTYTAWIQEDSGIEYLQAFFYFISSIASSCIAATFLRNRMRLHGILYGPLAMGLLFVSLEEVSWGQRLLRIGNPRYFALHNAQKEISLHNLDVIQPKLPEFYIAVGAYGAFAWLFPALFLPGTKANRRHVARFIVPDWFISPYFLLTFLMYTLLEYIARPRAGGFLAWRDQEPVELLLSLGFLLFLATNYVKLQLCLKERST